MFPDTFPSHIGLPAQRKHSNAPRVFPVILPSAETVGYYDYQKFMRVSENIDPSLIADKIQSAREICENYTALTFVGSQFDLYFDFIGPYYSAWTNYRLAEYYNVIELPRGPLVSVQGVFLRDIAGVETALTTDMYNVSQTRHTGRITINTWPFQEVINYPYIEQLRIRFTAGFAAVATFQTISPWKVTTQVPHGLNVAGKTPLYNRVRFRATGDTTVGVLPAPLADRVDYYAQVLDDTNFTLTSDAAGTIPVHFTTIGTGTIFMSLQVGGLPISINRAILSVASRDRFAADPRSLRKIDSETDMPKEAQAILGRYRRVTVS